MLARTAPLIAALMLTATVANSSQGIAGSADRRAEDAAAAVKRDKSELDKLRENRPAVHDRRALPAYDDALESAERRLEKAEHKADNTAREAVRAARQAEKAGKLRKLQQSREDRKERRRRQSGDPSRRPKH
jgi:hypothetical protein